MLVDKKEQFLVGGEGGVTVAGTGQDNFEFMFLGVPSRSAEYQA